MLPHFHIITIVLSTVNPFNKWTLLVSMIVKGNCIYNSQSGRVFSLRKFPSHRTLQRYFQ